MDSYISHPEIFPVELKTWMKKNHIVEFTGANFAKLLTADEVIEIPEFFEAYRNINGAVHNAKVPAPRFKNGEEQKNTAKYQHDKEKYKKELQQYIQNNPQLLEGLDAELTDRPFGRGWAQLLADRKRKTDQRAMILAQTQYPRGEDRLRPQRPRRVPGTAGRLLLDYDSQCAGARGSGPPAVGFAGDRPARRNIAHRALQLERGPLQRSRPLGRRFDARTARHDPRMDCRAR